jgi:ADP-heptose:LPS heptosyltransferase
MTRALGTAVDPTRRRWRGVARLLGLLREQGRRASRGMLELAVRAALALFPTPAPPAPAPRSIFVLRNNDVGDLLAITPLFEALRRRFPEAAIAAGVGSWNLPVLENNPHLSEVLTINAPWFNKYLGGSGPLARLHYLWRSREVRELASRRFDVGIDVLGSGWGSLLLLRGRIPRRLGVRGFAGGHTAVHEAVTFDPTEHVGRSALRFAEILGATQLPSCRPQLFLTAAEIEWAKRWWAAAGAASPRPRIVIGPGGGVEARCWPAESFVALASGLSRLGDLDALVLGGPRERRLVAAVAAAAARSFAEAPGLRQLFALVAIADLVVCNSSMLMHVAAAFAKPTLVLLGAAFPAASRHQSQWGYAGTSRSLGKEPGCRDTIYTPAEALAAVHEAIAALTAADGFPGAGLFAGGPHRPC